jgi:hypothetical protein
MADIVQQHTEAIHDAGMIMKFLESGDHRYQYWAMDKVFEGEKYTQARFAEPLLGILRGQNIFIAQHLLERLPSEVFESWERQVWLWDTYLRSPYRLQLAILDKLDQFMLQPVFTEKLIAQLDKSNAEQKRKIFSVLKNQSDLSKAGQKNLSLYLGDHQWGKEVYKVLSNQKKLDKSIRQELNHIENKQ